MTSLRQALPRIGEPTSLDPGPMGVRVREGECGAAHAPAQHQQPCLAVPRECRAAPKAPGWAHTRA